MAIFSTLFIVSTHFLQKIQIYYNTNTLEQINIEEIVEVYDYQVSYDINSIKSILDRKINKPIKVLRTAQIFEQRGNIYILVAETRRDIIDWFIAQNGRMTFEKTFNINDFNFHKILEKNRYIFQENWNIELEYGVKKYIEFEGVFVVN